MRIASGETRGNEYHHSTPPRMGLNLMVFIYSTLPGLYGNNFKFITMGFTHGYSNSSLSGLGTATLVCEKNIYLRRRSGVLSLVQAFLRI